MNAAYGFHAYKSVAPLKHISRSLVVEHMMFPRLQKRGPIEAKEGPSSNPTPPTFPRLQKRGPIEARGR